MTANLPRRALLAAALLPVPRVLAQPRPTLVLVHGAWMGAAAWGRTAALLEAAGHAVLVPELPAHGDDPTPAADATLDLYLRSLRTAIGDRRDLVLVGHSFGGILVSALAEAAAEQLRGLIYVAGYVPRDGESAWTLSQRDPQSLVNRYWRQQDPRQGSPATIAAEGIVPTFCAECGPEAAAQLFARHRAAPVPPLGTPVRLGPRFAGLPKAYVLTAEDRTITPELQRSMIAAAGIARVVELPNGHAPMLSAPDALARAIATLAADL